MKNSCGSPPAAAATPRRAPYLRWGKTLEPKLKTFKDLLRWMPTLLKDVAAIAEPRDLGVAPEHAGTPLLEEPFLRDSVVFLVQLSAGAASFGRLDMAALLATYPCHLRIASSNRGQGFGRPPPSPPTRRPCIGTSSAPHSSPSPRAPSVPAVQAIENAGRALDS
jgi:hypothetical protein